MSKKRLEAAEVFDELEVGLWGNDYTLRTITRSVGDRLAAAELKANQLPVDASNGDTAEALIEMIDVLLAPVKDAPAAGDVLRERWEQDKLGLDELTAFSESLQEEAAARRRPTSATRNAA